MSDLLVHPVTERQIAAFAQTPSHAVLLVGPAGSGKLALATELIEAILGLTTQGFADYPYGMVVSPQEGKAISIEAVRELEHFLSLKVPVPQLPNRAVIIENAHLLTIEAQNALLKTLEEPPIGTVVVLTASHSQALLLTIRSRAQLVTVQRPERAKAEAFFHDQGGFDEPAVKRAYAISAGLPGLMQALLAETEHPLLAATETARRLLSQTAYERLLLVDELAKQRQLARDTAGILQQMAHVSLQTATGPAAAKWQAVLTASYAAAEALQRNAQPKLALTNLMLQL
ncbi:MAG TPA: hypothetical protein VK712_01895 [Verrucomicrobiae bacterium]|jgi:hypothetical protein|nr:hypothetical protein [Verrucomicrobiae bacterium]